MIGGGLITYSGARAVAMSKRAQNKRIAQETVAMIESGGHYTPDDTALDVDISVTVACAMSLTRTYTPKESLRLVTDGVPVAIKHETTFEVALETTLASCQRVYSEHNRQDADGETGLLAAHPTRIGALNFASAKHPGGGFLSGSTAQEESLARSSALYACIRGSDMYAANTADPRRCLYQHYTIVSPEVPVFRDDDGAYISQPYPITFLSVPAVNAGVAATKGVSRAAIQRTMHERADRMLVVAVAHNIDVLVLGSWGCGVFGGDIGFIARTFVELLTTKYDGAFKSVVFATLDTTHKRVFEHALRAISSK